MKQATLNLMNQGCFIGLLDVFSSVIPDVSLFVHTFKVDELLMETQNKTKEEGEAVSNA
jgi:hypothetical protein